MELKKETFLLDGGRKKVIRKPNMAGLHPQPIILSYNFFLREDSFSLNSNFC
jgi:hypothetical protein